MLDEANAGFINGAVTIIRWSFYLAALIVALRAAKALFGWLWMSIKKRMGPVTPKAEIEKARQRMRDLGY